MCGIEKGGLYTLFCGFKLDNHLTGLIVKVLLKLVDSVWKFLDSLGKFRIDWNMRDQRSKSCDFS